MVWEYKIIEDAESSRNAILFDFGMAGWDLCAAYPMRHIGNGMVFIFKRPFIDDKTSKILDEDAQQEGFDFSNTKTVTAGTPCSGMEQAKQAPGPIKAFFRWLLRIGV